MSSQGIIKYSSITEQLLAYFSKKTIHTNKFLTVNQYANWFGYFALCVSVEELVNRYYGPECLIINDQGHLTINDKGLSVIVFQNTVSFLRLLRALQKLGLKFKREPGIGFVTISDSISATTQISIPTITLGFTLSCNTL